MINGIKIDLVFQVFGQSIKVDHGYALFSAISCILPGFHAENDVGLALIRGRYIGAGLLSISPRSRLTLRVPTKKIAQYIELAGKTLDLEGHPLRIGVPNSHALIPAASLYAHLVTTKNGHDRQRFQDEISRQMTTINSKGKVSVGKRRTFKIHGKQVVGYSLMISELAAEESIALQEQGLGGRRKMGCGFFIPWKRT